MTAYCAVGAAVVACAKSECCSVCYCYSTAQHCWTCCYVCTCATAAKLLQGLRLLHEVPQRRRIIHGDEQAVKRIVINLVRYNNCIITAQSYNKSSDAATLLHNLTISAVLNVLALSQQLLSRV
jgi:hypothetical protein